VKNYRHFLAQYPQNVITTQLQDLAANEMMQTIYPNLSTLATICLTMQGCPQSPLARRSTALLRYKNKKNKKK